MKTTAMLLGSFAYWARHDLPGCFARARAHDVDIDFMADSGAFTAYTTGKKITVKQYATWLRLHGPLINCAMTLDVIGDPAASARNTLALEDAVGDSTYVIPIFHVGSPWTELERWCSTHPYVALGGGVAVAGRKQAFLQWLIHAHRIAAEHGTVLHGLGMTKPPYPDLLPFYSVDSSYWSQGPRTGLVTLYDPRRRAFYPVRSIRRAKVFTKPERNPLVRAYGGDPAALAHRGFGIVQARGKELAAADRAWMLDSAITSWLLYGRDLRDRHHVPAPGTVRGTGPKVYLAATGEKEVDLICRLTANLPAPERMTRR